MVGNGNFSREREGRRGKRNISHDIRMAGSVGKVRDELLEREEGKGEGKGGGKREGKGERRMKGNTCPCATIGKRFCRWLCGQTLLLSSIPRLGHLCRFLGL